MNMDSCVSVTVCVHMYVCMYACMYVHTFLCKHTYIPRKHLTFPPRSTTSLFGRAL